jgi:hypothetical protein
MDGWDIFIAILFFFGGGGVITGIVMAVEIKKHRPVKSATNADQYLVAGETQITNTEDTFLRTHTTRVKVASSKPRK